MPELTVILRVVVSLGIVLLLAVVVLRFGLPRLSSLRPSGPGPIQVVSVVSLDRQVRVGLVRVGEIEYTLAWGPHGMVRLGERPASPALPATPEEGEA